VLTRQCLLMWSNGILKHGWFSDECEGAMWPSLGFPHGTPLLAHWLFGKILWVVEVKPVTSMGAKYFT
jgi:hypothetical protein